MQALLESSVFLRSVSRVYLIYISFCFQHLAEARKEELSRENIGQDVSSFLKAEHKQHLPHNCTSRFCLLIYRALSSYRLNIVDFYRRL